jgi:thiosulfate/3-mercaptopyruvate sulfurtransferase
MDYSTLIDPEILHANLDDPGWVVADCRFDLGHPDLGEQRYLEAHIPGALYLHIERDLSSPPDGVNGRHPLPDLKRLEEVFSNCGIQPGVQVVAYDDIGGGFAARLWWLLRYTGHAPVAVLNGGFQAWLEAGNPTECGRERRSRAEYHAQPRSDMIANAEQAREVGATRSLVLIDSRAPERYRGEIEPIDKIAGRIPGAVNHFWQDNLLPSGKFASPETLASEFNTLLKGRSADETIVCCGFGVTACQNILSMEHAGLHGARLYPVSWSGWITDPARPVATGEEQSESHPSA